MALHREAFRGRDIDPEHLTERFESFVIAATRRMTARGLASIYGFWRDGEAIISGLMVFGREFDAAYTVGASQEALQRYQWSSLSFWYELDIARRNNSACLSMLRGEEPYKLRWNTRIVPNYRVILRRSLAFWSFYVAYLSLRSEVKRCMSSERTPQWIKSAVNWLGRRW
jgi:hypothetical protein